MADLASTRVFGKLTVMHEAIIKANAEIVGNITASKFIGDGSQLTALPWGQLTGAPATATRWPAWGEVTGKPSTFAPTSHSHVIGNVTGLQAAIDSKANTSTQVIAGTGLSGGGTLAANRTLAVTYGTTAGTAAQGNDARLSNSREWTAAEVSQAEAEAGTATTARKWTAQRVRQAIVAWFNGVSGALGRTILTRTTAAQVRSDIGLGTAATTAATDYAKSQGRVVNNGNLFLDSGMYGINGSPTNTVSQYGAMIVARNSDTGLQISGGHNTDNLHFRGFSSSGSAFTPWRQVYHTGNLLNIGTTSATARSALGLTDAATTTVATIRAGNAATATALQTARTIGGVSFNGTANINLPGVNVAGNQSTTGNAASATKLATARTINGTSFDGSANITVADSTKLPLAGGTITGNLTVNGQIYAKTFNSSSPFSFLNVGSAQSLLTGGILASNAYADVSKIPTNGIYSKGNIVTDGSFVGSGASLTGINASNITTGTIPAARVPTLNQSTTGNAATATTLQTARTINGVSFNGSANITVADSTKLPLAGGTLTGQLRLGSNGGTSWIAGTSGSNAAIRYNTSAATAANWHAWIAGRDSVNNGWAIGTLGANFHVSFATAANITAGNNVTTQVLTASPSGVAVAGTLSATGGFSGNAATATKLVTPRAINGVNFDGSAAITITAAANGGTSAACSGNAASATKLATARTINGVSFNGTANITVADATKLPLAGGIITGTTASTSATTGALQCRGGLGVSGNIYAGGNVTAYSDIRLKKDIERIPDALAKVIQLNGVTYTRMDSGERHTGLIAQEVQKVLPEAVSGDEYLGVAYGNMVGLLVEAVKELSEQVEALKGERG